MLLIKILQCKNALIDNDGQNVCHQLNDQLAKDAKMEKNSQINLHEKSRENFNIELLIIVDVQSSKYDDDDDDSVHKKRHQQFVTVVIVVLVVVF